VDHELEHLVERNGRIESKGEGAVVEMDDIAVINFDGKVDGVQFEGGQGENFELTIGAKMFIGDFEEQLIGLKAGDKKVVKVTFPEDYQAEEVKGKDAEFDVEILDIKSKEYPEVDDEFASEVSEFETLEELKASIREGLTKDAENRGKNELNSNLIKALAEKAEIDVPNAMVETSIDRMVRDFEQRIQQQGISMDMYLQMTGQDKTTIRDMFRDNAMNVVKNDLLIEAIMEKEGITATEEELVAKAEEIAKMYGAQMEELKEMLLNSNKKELEMEVTTAKVFALLEEHAVLTEVEKSTAHNHGHDHEDHDHEDHDHEGHDHE
jgi:trigger factor